MQRRAPRPASRFLALAAAAVACLAGLLLTAAGASAQTPARPTGHRARDTAAKVAPPAPAVSIASTSPVLAQTAPGTWITTVLIADSGAAARNVAYKLVPLSPNHRVVTGTVVGCYPGTARHCPLALNQVTRVRVRFRSRFPVPLAQAALVIDGHPAAGSAQPATPALVPQEVQLTIARQVGPWYDLGVPLAVAAALAVLTVLLILLLAGRRRPARAWVDDHEPDDGAVPPALGRPGMANGDAVKPAGVSTAAVGETTLTELGSGGSPTWTRSARPERSEPQPDGESFLRRPIYASASWSFKDSWATNITALGGAVGAVAAVAGATSTVFPGVALDRFALLLAFFAAVVVMGPLVLGLCLPRSDDPDRVRATGFSLVVAAFVTLIGVGGEIGTIGSLIWLSSPAREVRVGLLLLPVAAFVIVAWYACRTTTALAAHSPHHGGHASSTLSAGRDSALTL